jgi:Zn ribbon nucleic-acid-binding protein
MITKRQITDAKRAAKRWHRDQRHGGPFFKCIACGHRRRLIDDMIERRARGARP